MQDERKKESLPISKFAKPNSLIMTKAESLNCKMLAVNAGFSIRIKPALMSLIPIVQNMNHF